MALAFLIPHCEDGSVISQRTQYCHCLILCLFPRVLFLTMSSVCFLGLGKEKIRKNTVVSKKPAYFIVHQRSHSLGKVKDLLGTHALGHEDVPSSPCLRGFF